MLPLKSADLCSGIGLHAWWSQSFAKPEIYCEIELDPRALLQSAMTRGLIAEAPVWDDVKTIRLPEGVEFASCSWPCQARRGSPRGRRCIPKASAPAFAAQGNSIAGKRKGNDDERSGLIYNVLEKINEAKPAICFLENVPAALKSSCRLIIDSLRDYDVAWGRVGASDVGYLHK